MLEWDDLRTFLAITRHGNLSAAARALKVTQTTMGRRLEGLHQRAGARLLQKTPTGFVLTVVGHSVLANVERMEAEALAVERTITGQDARLEGEVRITTVETFGARVLVPLFAELRRKQPGLVIELITDTRALSLSRREADIAVRLAQFEQQDAVVRKIGEMAFGLFASTEYLESSGAPDFKAGAPGHAVIALQQDLALLPEARWLDELTRLAEVVLRSNSRDAHLQAALAGYGIACLPKYLASSTGLVEMPTRKDPLRRGIWTGVHRDTRHVPRIRIVLDHLTDGLKMLSSELGLRAS